jgi:hypothetical protein
MTKTTKPKPIFSSPSFRSYPVELVEGPDGTLIGMQLCEELDPESGRWEPFYTQFNYKVAR